MLHSHNRWEIKCFVYFRSESSLLQFLLIFKACMVNIKCRSEYVISACWMTVHVLISNSSSSQRSPVKLSPLHSPSAQATATRPTHLLTARCPARPLPPPAAMPTPVWLIAALHSVRHFLNYLRKQFSQSSPLGVQAFDFIVCGNILSNGSFIFKLYS